MGGKEKVDSQERSNCSMGKKMEPTPRSSYGAGGWDAGTGSRVRRGLGWQRGAPTTRVGAFVLGKKGERFGLLERFGLPSPERKVLKGMFRTFIAPWTRSYICLFSILLSLLLMS